MADLRWREKLDRDGKVVPRCWITDTGFTVAEYRTPDVRFSITRKGSPAAFAYCSTRESVIEIIQADMALVGAVA